MPSTHELDAITLDDLRATGATKWTQPDGAIGAFVAEMDFGVAEPIRAALHREVDRGLFAYLPAHYRSDMQRAVAGYLERHQGWSVPVERIHEMPDVVSVYRAAYTFFSEPGSKIIVPTPAYMPFLSVPAIDGREVIEVPMARRDGGDGRLSFSDDLAALERAFDAGGHLLVLCNPHNPTGRVFTREELLAIEELVARRGGRVFADEIWMPLALDRPHLSYASLSERAAGHTITAVAASKGFNLPGLKCAQLITSNDADQERWLAVGQRAMHGAANLGLVATAAAFTDGDAWNADITAYLVRNRDALERVVRERMPLARVTHAEGTYVAWLDLSRYRIAGSLREFFREHAGVLCTEGTACGAVGAGHVRFIFAMPQPIMLDALDRMARALAAHAPAD